MRHELNADERAIYGRYAQLALPRHTSYPIAPMWRDAYRSEQYVDDLRYVANQLRPLSLYVHVPFCEKLCYYCACTKEIVPAAKHASSDPGEPFLEGLDLEIRRVAECVGTVPVHQVHLGGGSPTFLSAKQLEHLWRMLEARFAIGEQAEIAIEIDPRITSREQLTVLRSLGFNRISLGVQDFSAAVQRAVNRIQPLEKVQQVVDACRELGFTSINFDLIYGLPFQTLQTMADTLEQTIALGPDRVAFYRLAVIPEIFRWQNVFHPQDLPAGDLPLDLNLLAIRRFQEAGYEFIGLDHFAKPTEPLARASREQTLHRNFQGMTTGKELELVGLGPSAISQMDRAFAQNAKASDEWRSLLTQGLATERGLRLTADDRLRRELLQQLYGYGLVSKPSLERRFGVPFDAYFADEMQRLGILVDEGLVTTDTETIQLTEPLGRLLVRVVAAVFDGYLPKQAYRHGLPVEQSSRVG